MLIVITYLFPLFLGRNGVAIYGGADRGEETGISYNEGLTQTKAALLFRSARANLGVEKGDFTLITIHYGVNERTSYIQYSLLPDKATTFTSKVLVGYRFSTTAVVSFPDVTTRLNKPAPPTCTLAITPALIQHILAHDHISSRV